MIYEEDSLFFEPYKDQDEEGGEETPEDEDADEEEKSKDEGDDEDAEME